MHKMKCTSNPGVTLKPSVKWGVNQAEKWDVTFKLGGWKNQT